MWKRAALRALFVGPVAAGLAVNGSINPLPQRRVALAKASKAENSERRIQRMFDRFHTFATIQIDEQCFMTPADFLEAVTEANPRKSAFKKSFSRDEILRQLKESTPDTSNADIKVSFTFFSRLFFRKVQLFWN